MHLDAIKVLFTNSRTKELLKKILKCTLKQRLHVSVQSPSSRSVLFELAKVTVIRIQRCGSFSGVAAYAAYSGNSIQTFRDNISGPTFNGQAVQEDLC